MLSAVSGGIPGALPSSLATPGATGRETLTMSHPLGAGAASPALAVAPVSTQMGRYTLVERIGEGGMAEIFFARAHGAEGFMRELVVKRMHPHLARNRLAVNQFIDEARVQAELVHPNIVPVLDFGKAGDEYFLALDLIRGRDLGKVIARHVETSGESLSLPVAFYVMHEVLEALEFAHTKKGRDGRPLEVVHRDVAPGNVLISFLGEVKLSDFGIAKAEHRVSFTEIGMVKGNASFMSPEQARGEDVDHRSDIFSAGVVLFYMLTAKLLYRGETTLNQLLRAAVGPATSQFNTLASLPPVAQSILTRALAVDVKERFQTARDFAVTLAPFMASRKELNALMGSLFPPSERL
jgi:serine/threonine-protein kinase